MLPLLLIFCSLRLVIPALPALSRKPYTFTTLIQKTHKVSLFKHSFTSNIACYCSSTVCNRVREYLQQINRKEQTRQTLQQLAYKIQIDEINPELEQNFRSRKTGVCGWGTPDAIQCGWDRQNLKITVAMFVQLTYHRRNNNIWFTG